jgi:hypothetical protein
VVSAMHNRYTPSAGGEPSAPDEHGFGVTRASTHP